MQTICMNGQYLKKLPVDGFEWVEELSQFKEGFIKNYDEVEYPKKLFSLHSALSFLPEKNKI